MEQAIRVLNDKKREYVYAENLDEKDRNFYYICPYCGKRVILALSQIKSNYFKHYDSSPDCEEYYGDILTDSTPTSKSNYEVNIMELQDKFELKDWEIRGRKRPINLFKNQQESYIRNKYASNLQDKTFNRLFIKHSKIKRTREFDILKPEIILTVAEKSPKVYLYIPEQRIEIKNSDIDKFLKENPISYTIKIRTKNSFREKESRLKSHTHNPEIILDKQDRIIIISPVYFQISELLYGFFVQYPEILDNRIYYYYILDSMNKYYFAPFQSGNKEIMRMFFLNNKDPFSLQPKEFLFLLSNNLEIDSRDAVKEERFNSPWPGTHLALVNLTKSKYISLHDTNGPSTNKIKIWSGHFFTLKTKNKSKNSLIKDLFSQRVKLYSTNELILKHRGPRKHGERFIIDLYTISNKTAHLIKKKFISWDVSESSELDLKEIFQLKRIPFVIGTYRLDIYLENVHIDRIQFRLINGLKIIRIKKNEKQFYWKPKVIFPARYNEINYDTKIYEAFNYYGYEKYQIKLLLSNNQESYRTFLEINDQRKLDYRFGDIIPIDKDTYSISLKIKESNNEVKIKIPVDFFRYRLGSSIKFDKIEIIEKNFINSAFGRSHQTDRFFSIISYHGTVHSNKKYKLLLYKLNPNGTFKKTSTTFSNDSNSLIPYYESKFFKDEFDFNHLIESIILCNDDLALILNITTGKNKKEPNLKQYYIPIAIFTDNISRIVNNLKQFGISDGKYNIITYNWKDSFYSNMAKIKKSVVKNQFKKNYLLEIIKEERIELEFLPWKFQIQKFKIPSRNTNIIFIDFLEISPVPYSKISDFVEVNKLLHGNIDPALLCENKHKIIKKNEINRLSRIIKYLSALEQEDIRFQPIISILMPLIKISKALYVNSNSEIGTNLHIFNERIGKYKKSDIANYLINKHTIDLMIALGLKNLIRFWAELGELAFSLHEWNCAERIYSYLIKLLKFNSELKTRNNQISKIKIKRMLIEFIEKYNSITSKSNKSLIYAMIRSKINEKYR